MKSSKLIMGCLATLGLTASAGTALAQDDAAREAIAERLKPVGELCVQGEDCGTASASASAGGTSDSASSGGGGDIDAAGIYNSVCMACHETGAAGAPVRGDEAAWADRVEKGFATLLDHTINGFNAMPARGGNPNLSDAEMEAATAYMVEPVMDVSELGGGAGEASADSADNASAEDAAAVEETAAADNAATEDAAAAEDTAVADNAATDDAAAAEDTAVADSAATDDAAADDAAAADSAATDDAAAAEDTAAADNAATEVAAADLPGADKIGTCVACHGQDGHGTAPMYPNLAEQNVAYLENAMKAYRDGQRQGGMSAVMTPMAASLSDEDITDIANYYNQQPR